VDIGGDLLVGISDDRLFEFLDPFADLFEHDE
jgi:hypothetical protein